MELDFSTIKALSSPTRVRILSQVLDAESTPTMLSEDLGKSKSTVSAHLQKLTDAGLLEKESVEGRRRVVYRPTGKARAIVEGRERKVRFSIASSGLTGLAGAALIGSRYMDRASRFTGDRASGVTAMTAEAPSTMAEGAASGMGGFNTADVFLVLGVSLLLVAAGTFAYGLLMRKLG